MLIRVVTKLLHENDNPDSNIDTFYYIHPWPWDNMSEERV